MPIIQMEILPRDLAQKRQLVKALTDTTCEVLGCPPQAVSIIIREMQPENYAQAGVLRCDQKA